MKWIVVVFSIVALSTAFVNCSGDEGLPGGSSVSPYDYTKLIPDCFVATSANQIITKGDFFANATWNDPHVIKVGSTYVMYASADHNFDEDIAIYRLTSTDGLAWTLNPSTPVLSKSSGLSDWDRKSVETPAVIYFLGRYRMFYTGYATNQTDTASYKVGYATSTNGITWTREDFILEPTAPSAGANLDFNQFIVAEPAPVIFNGKLYVYFTALGANASVGTTLQTIGLTTTSDGNTWTTPEQVLVPDQTLYPRASNFKGYSTPHAIMINGKVNLFFDVVEDTPFSQVKIHRAVSTGGKTGWVHDSEEIFDKTEFTWTANQIRSPSLLMIGTKLYMWFAGDAGVNNLGIGAATCDLTR